MTASAIHKIITLPIMILSIACVKYKSSFQIQFDQLKGKFCITFNVLILRLFNIVQNTGYFIMLTLKYFENFAKYF